jgi:hypothetical protein
LRAPRRRPPRSLRDNKVYNQDQGFDLHSHLFRSSEAQNIQWQEGADFTEQALYASPLLSRPSPFPRCTDADETPTAKASISTASKASLKVEPPPYITPTAEEHIPQRAGGIFCQQAGEPSNGTHPYLYTSAGLVERAQPRNPLALELETPPCSR